MSISVIAGLGNPGLLYRSTRHNVGYRVVEAFAKHFGVSWKKEKRFKAKVTQAVYNGEPLFLVKPLTYMNLSGQAIAALCRFYKLPAESVVVVYDDINLDLGRSKLSESGSGGGHNGVSNVIEHLGTNFLRFRIGIGGKAHADIDLKDHVLGKCTSEEKDLMSEKMPNFVECLCLLLDKGVRQAMNFINQKAN